MVDNNNNIFDKNADINEIEENKLWLGNTFAAANIQDLKNKGIKKILTVMNTDPSRYFFNEHGFIHKIINIMDFDSVNIIQYFGECLNFMKGEEKVFVHCGVGVSRSATIVIAYLMWKYKMKYDDAFQFVKNKRPIICPNLGFTEQLKIFEKLLTENNYDINLINFKEVNWVPPAHMPILFSYY